MPKVIDFHRLRDIPRNRQQQIEQSEKRLAEQLGDLDGLRAQLTEARQENKRLKRRLLEAETLAKDAHRVIGWMVYQAGGRVVVTTATLNATCSPDFKVTRTPEGDAVITAEKPR